MLGRPAPGALLATGASLYARLAPPVLRPLNCIVVDDLAALAPETVLDVGTGPGALAVEIATRCASCSVIGVDLAPDVLATAEQRARDAGVSERAQFVVADAAALPLADATIDVSVSTWSLHHWREVPAILRELRRVVRPGGRILLFDLRFSYSPRQFAAFVADTPFSAEGMEDRRIRAGRLPIALYERFALRRP